MSAAPARLDVCNQACNHKGKYLFMFLHANFEKICFPNENSSIIGSEDFLYLKSSNIFQCIKRQREFFSLGLILEYICRMPFFSLYV